MRKLSCIIDKNLKISYVKGIECLKLQKGDTHFFDEGARKA